MRGRMLHVRCMAPGPGQGLEPGLSLWSWEDRTRVCIERVICGHRVLLASRANCPPGCAKASCPCTSASIPLRGTRVYLPQTTSTPAVTWEPALTVGRGTAGGMHVLSSPYTGGRGGLKDPHPRPGLAP